MGYGKLVGGYWTGAIARQTELHTLTLTSGSSVNNEAIDVRGFAGGIIETPGAWTAADIGFQACSTPNGTFVTLCDLYGAAVKITGVTTNAAKAYVLPDEVFGVHYLKIWSKNTASEAVVAQGAGRTLKLMLKG